MKNSARLVKENIQNATLTTTLATSLRKKVIWKVSNFFTVLSTQIVQSYCAPLYITIHYDFFLEYIYISEKHEAKLKS